MIRYRNLTIIPTYHSNLDFVHEVRVAFYQNPPDIIAVEFPKNLKPKILQAVTRLPQISLVTYFDQFLKQQTYIPIEGGDSLVEAIRLGREYGTNVEFIDLFVNNYVPLSYNMPDSYVLNHLSLKELFSVVNTELKLEESAIKRLKQQRVKIQKEESRTEDQMDRLESESGDVNPSGAKAQEWLKNRVELDDFREHYMAAKLTDLMVFGDQILVIMGMAHWAGVKAILDGDLHEEGLSYLSPEVTSEIFNVLESDLEKVLLETPNVLFQWEKYRKQQKEAIDSFSHFDRAQYKLLKFDPFRAIKLIYEGSVERYKDDYNEEISLHKLKSLFQYVRSLPLAEGMFRPHLFELVLAAKSIVNDDFAWLVWEICKIYSYSVEDPMLDPAQITDHGIFIRGKYFKISRSKPVKLTRIKLPLKPKPKEDKKGEWRKIWNDEASNLVSHLPEDIFEENYFQHLRKRSLALMKEHYTKVHVFTSSLMDGIDFRETLRNWIISDHKIYVREDCPIQGEVDSVVIIFDEDDLETERYPYRTMWYAEHKKESDLALYSTFPGEVLVGPGISRVELGGVVSFYPPRGVPDIWTIQFLNHYPMVQTKAEQLILAGLVYAQTNIVALIAHSKPRNIFYQIAHKLGIKIIHIPLDRFNPVSLHALRNLHMLAGRKVRENADRYIKKRKY